jgi:hypothetical protein
VCVGGPETGEDDNSVHDTLQSGKTCTEITYSYDLDRDRDGDKGIVKGGAH